MGNNEKSLAIRNTEYEIIKELGKGGYGRVILVKDKSNNKPFAIKEIQINNEMKNKIKDIEKEADILSKFNCKNIVKYYDSYLYKGKFYILMEYCERQNLKDFIDKNIKNNELIEENKICDIIIQICTGLKEIHDKNIIHRDIKPENIFINEKMEIKIGDFGISKQFNPNKEFTYTFNKLVSIYYTAPEIIRDGIYNKKSDMYSLGCIIYELINLTKYYNDKEFNEIKTIDPEIYNDNWEKIINSLLQKDYNKRMNINEVYDIISNEIYKNFIIGEIYVNKDDINEDIRIINSIEDLKRRCYQKDREDDYKYENKKEIVKENIEIKINGKIIEFAYYYKFKEEGKYIIEYIFKNNLTKTNHMFYDCDSLRNLNLSNFNTQNVTNMSYMFYDCKSLINLNLSNFNTQNVSDMSYMFYECNSLTNLNLSNFNTRNVNDMSCMFYSCNSLTNLNLSNFNTQNVYNMISMFSGCNSLKKLNLSNFKTQNVTNICYMFYESNSLKKLNLSNFKTQNVTNMCYMFYNCHSLTNLNLSNFNTQNVSDMSYMFYGCKSLINLNLSNFNTQNVNSMCYMFDSCNSLKKDNMTTIDNKILEEFDD